MVQFHFRELCSHVKKPATASSGACGGPRILQVSDARQSTLTHMFAARQPIREGSERHRTITKGIAECCDMDARPISMVEDRGFRHLLQAIEPMYHPACASTLQNKCVIPMYHETQGAVKKDITLTTRHAVTTDGWISLRNDEYVTTTCLM